MMTKAAANRISKVTVYHHTAKQGPQFYTVQHVQGGYIVTNCKDSRRSYLVQETGIGLVCPCPAYQKTDYCKHQIMILDAKALVEELRAEATDDAPAPIIYTDTMIDFDVFSEPVAA